MRASTWPACTAMPSCSVVVSTTPETLDLMVAELRGVSEPDRGKLTANERAADGGDVAGRQFEDVFLSLWLQRPQQGRGRRRRIALAAQDGPAATGQRHHDQDGSRHTPAFSAHGGLRVRGQSF